MKMKMKEKITTLNEDNRGVSPVIGVIMMIAIVVIIAAVVAAFAYGIIGGVNKAPSTALVVEGVSVGKDQIMKVFHHGGDSITDAFVSDNKNDISEKWANLKIKLNGATVSNAQAEYAKMNNTGINETGKSWKVNFEPGDVLEIKFEQLNVSDSIVVLHDPSDSILQRVTVM